VVTEPEDEELDQNLPDGGLANASEDLGPALGEDPFSDLDVGWLTRDQGELSVEVLGHDPFEDMDLQWLEEEPEMLFPGPLRIRPSRGLGAAEEEEEEGLEELPEIEEPPTVAAILGAPAPPIPQPAVAPPAPAAPPPRPAPVVLPARPAAPAPVAEPQPPRPERVTTPEATFHFPTDFRWGVAASAHQVEGDNRANDWWAWEETPGHIRNNHHSGNACNWWQNAEADFDRAAGLGVNALRLSVEWSRIEPRPGSFDEAALQRYAELLGALRERNIEPMVTLHHFTNPQWLAEQGGWENPEAVGLFARFVRRTVEALGRLCELWCTVNEPNVYAYMGYVEGRFPPGRADLRAAQQVARHLLEGHAAAYREIHAVQRHARVGLALHMRVFEPASPNSALDQRAAAFADRAFNGAFLDALVRGRWTAPLGAGSARRLRHTLDWIGLNYYARDAIAYDRAQRGLGGVRRVVREEAEMLDGDYGEFYPEGLFRCLQRLSRLRMPVYITENGLPDADDDQRPRYLLTHLHQVWRALQLGCPVQGYFHWTLVDNFEWTEGWTLRFGLFELDPRTQVRTPRPSARLYAALTRANAITPELIDSHCPEVRPQLLPGQAVRA
jgi:beta-glucosidase